MPRWVVAAVAALIIVTALFGLWLGQQPTGQRPAASPPQTQEQQQALISEQEAIARGIDHLKRVGVKGEFGPVLARQMPLVEAIRTIAAPIRFEQALKDARVGQEPGRERSRLVWFLEVRTNQNAYLSLFMLVDAQSGQVLDWPNLPVDPPPSALMPPTPTPGPELTQQEIEARRDLMATLMAPGHGSPSAGLETRGKRLVIAKREIQLPPDAYILHHFVGGMCGPGPCEYPRYILQRGLSTITVGANSGRILEEEMAPGEEAAFDFLKEALR